MLHLVLWFGQFFIYQLNILSVVSIATII